MPLLPPPIPYSEFSFTNLGRGNWSVNYRIPPTHIADCHVSAKHDKILFRSRADKDRWRLFPRTEYDGFNTPEILRWLTDEVYAQNLHFDRVNYNTVAKKLLTSKPDLARIGGLARQIADLLTENEAAQDIDFFWLLDQLLRERRFMLHVQNHAHNGNSIVLTAQH